MPRQLNEDNGDDDDMYEQYLTKKIVIEGIIEIIKREIDIDICSPD